MNERANYLLASLVLSAILSFIGCGDWYGLSVVFVEKVILSLAHKVRWFRMVALWACSRSWRITAKISIPAAGHDLVLCAGVVIGAYNRF